MPAAPLQFLLLVFAGWVNRGQREILEYLQEENRVLREQLGGPQDFGVIKLAERLVRQRDFRDLEPREMHGDV